MASGWIGMAPRLYSYKMTNDSGFAPNPFWGVLTLATCKASMRRSKKVGDWIAGFTSGAKNFGKQDWRFCSSVTVFECSRRSTVSASASALTNASFDGLTVSTDDQSGTAGWQDLIDLAGDMVSLRKSLAEQTVRQTAKAELASALKQIDNGIEEVLNEKFSTLTSTVNAWWSLLRRANVLFGCRTKGKDNDRFKGGLSPHHDQSNPTIRDVSLYSVTPSSTASVLFLARAEHYRRVRCGNLTCPKSLAEFNSEWLSDDELRKRLPPLAPAIAEDIRGKPYAY